ncbi:uncharacterized protein LOC135619836 isoform X2 [Musa acuminata AAA Group]|uniref:uncharacterized protein LOC135619836 isoform X2 n=1 Tax=Musa acuminata AAA Group TaxID=214697 RepID=UPI0031DA3FF2
MAAAEGTGWVKISATALAIAAVAAIVTGSFFNQKARRLASRIRELEASLAAALEKSASERRGRTRAQQALRNAFTQQSSDGSKQAAASAYPMAPIGTVRSCFSTRNGTPRQPLLVPLARACLVFDAGRVPKEALEGLAEYSHCWILYVFHLNTDLDKLWREPSRSKFKAKVRVPRLKGGKMGVLATRSPHRPCPIGLTVAKPVLDIKPYLPYSDSIQGATVPNWVKADSMLAVASVNFSPDFSSSLSGCWMQAAKQSLYASQDEFQDLIKELLSWDIRSLCQLNHPHNVSMENESHDVARGLEDIGDEESCQTLTEKPSSSSLGDVIYHLVVEEIDISYRIDDSSNILVEKASSVFSNDRNSCHYYNYTMWKNKLSIQDHSATNLQRVEMQEGRWSCKLSCISIRTIRINVLDANFCLFIVITWGHSPLLYKFSSEMFPSWCAL